MCAREYSTFVQSTYIYITYFRAKNDYQIRIQNPAIQRYSLAFYSTVFTLLPDLYLRYYTLFYFLFCTRVHVLVYCLQEVSGIQRVREQL